MDKIKVLLIFMGIATDKGILDPQMMVKIMTMMIMMIMMKIMMMTMMMMMMIMIMNMKMINPNFLYTP